MIVLKIENVKEFMSRLFAGDMFDRFHVRDCDVTTFVTFCVEGKLHGEWLDSDERPEDTMEFVLWKQLKPIVFSLIKGKKPPGSMRLDFCHYMKNGDVGSIRVQYEKEELLLYTGYMERNFSLDKGSAEEWDENCLGFIKKNNVVSTQLS